VGARHARTIVNGRKQANTPGLWNNFDFWFQEKMLKDWWDTTALLVGVISYRFRIIGVANETWTPLFFFSPKVYNLY
jgi:hypothetical protein